MNIKKTTAILASWALLHIVYACCDCGPFDIYELGIDSATAFNLDNSGKIPQVSETNIIPKEAYGIRIKFDLHETACKKPWTNGLFSQAYAIDCRCEPDTQVVVQDTISAILIKTVNFFDPSHPAQSDVTDLFRVLRYNEYYPIKGLFAMPDDIYLLTLKRDPIDVFLMNPPENAGNHQFKIDIFLKNKAQLSFITGPVNLK